jgi:5'-3' exonuclease
MKEKILCIDLANMFWLCRGQHTVEESLAGGWPTVGEFLIKLNYWIRIHEPTSIVLMDDGYPDWRYNIFQSYKQGRDETRQKDPMTEDFVRQKKDIKENVIPILPIYILHHPKLEADDLVYIFCKYLEKNNFDGEVFGFSTDDDWRQLMTYFPFVKIWNPRSKILPEAAGSNYVLYKSILGDTSDKIPGFAKIGPKTAEKLANDQTLFNEWFNKLTIEEQQRFGINQFLIDWNSIPKEYYDEVMTRLDNKPEFPLFKPNSLKIHCKQRRIFRFLKNFEIKEYNFGSLKPIFK